MKSFEGQHCDRDYATAAANSSWMRALRAVLRLLRTLAHAAGANATAAPTSSLNIEYQDSASWGVRMAGGIVRRLISLGDRTAEGALQLPVDLGATALPRHLSDCTKAGLALLEVASLWDQLTQCLGPSAEEVLAQCGWLGSKQRCQSIAYHIFCGLSVGQYSKAEGMAELGDRLLSTAISPYHRDMGRLELLLSWLFR